MILGQSQRKRFLRCCGNEWKFLWGKGNSLVNYISWDEMNTALFEYIPDGSAIELVIIWLRWLNRNIAWEIWCEGFSGVTGWISNLEAGTSKTHLDVVWKAANQPTKSCMGITLCAVTSGGCITIYTVIAGQQGIGTMQCIRQITSNLVLPAKCHLGPFRLI
jgi:hypothetical protein